MPFELRPHTADIGVHASGDRLDTVFDAVAAGLAAATADDVPSPTDSFTLEFAADDLEGLLYDFLDQLIYERDVQSILPVETCSTIEEIDGEYVLRTTVGHVPLATVSGREIKAVTYADMRIEPTTDGWEAEVVFDV